jgi:hypothetical protein
VSTKDDSLLQVDCEIENPPDGVEMVLREADRAAYEAKSSAKARVTLRVVGAFLTADNSPKHPAV